MTVYGVNYMINISRLSVNGTDTKMLGKRLELVTIEEFVSELITAAYLQPMAPIGLKNWTHTFPFPVIPCPSLPQL
jgi:hypothetical protein